MSFILFFLFRGVQRCFATTSHGFGLMDMYVNDPKKMNQSKHLLEALNLSKLTMQRIAMCFGIHKYGSGMVSVKLSIRVLPGFVFLK